MIYLNHQEYISIQEMAEELKVCKVTARRYIKHFNIPTFRLGKRFLMSKSDISRCILAGRQNNKNTNSSITIL